MPDRLSRNLQTPPFRPLLRFAQTLARYYLSTCRAVPLCIDPIDPHSGWAEKTEIVVLR